MYKESSHPIFKLNVLECVRLLRAVSFRTYVLVLTAVLLVAEFSIRAIGMLDFPLYNVDATIGYLPEPNQKGSYLLTRGWVFNDHSMASRKNFVPSNIGTLVIGDSIVYGGNPYLQEDRVGNLLASLRKEDVWSAAAGGWSLKNELAYVFRYTDELRALRRIVFVVNSGDFNVPPASWRCEEQHPTHTPNVALWYVFEKNVLNPSECKLGGGYVIPDFDLHTSLEKLHSIFGSKIQFVFYPDAFEVRQPNAGKAAFDKYSAYLAEIGFDKIDWVGSDARWKLAFYRDDIHPTPEGNRVLARLVSEYIDEYK